MAITKTGQDMNKEAILGSLGGGLARGFGALGKLLKKRWKGALGSGVSGVSTVAGGIDEAKKLNRSGFGMLPSAKGGMKEFGRLYGQRPAGRRAINTVGAGAIGLGAYGMGQRGRRQQGLQLAQTQPSIYNRSR